MRNYSEKELLKEMKTARKALRSAVLSLSIINNEVIGSNYNFRKEEDNDTLDEIFLELKKMEEDFNSLRRSGEKSRKNCERVHSLYWCAYKWGRIETHQRRFLTGMERHLLIEEKEE